MQTSPQTLVERLARNDTPMIVDVCLDADFSDLPVLIPGARRMHHSAVTDDAACDRAAEIVIVCQKGLKLSQGAAARLRARGARASYLSGGISEWVGAGLPVRRADDPNPTRWVLNERADCTDLVAGWCVRRLIDRDAELIWVEEDQMGAVAERFDAVAALSTCDRLRSALPEWSRLDRFFEQTRPEQLKTLLCGAASLYPMPETRFEAVTPVLDMLFAATSKPGGRVQ